MEIKEDLKGQQNITTTALGIMVLNSNIIINSFVKLVIIIINLIIIFLLQELL